MEFRFIRGNCKFIVFIEKREESDYKPRENVLKTNIEESLAQVNN
jgi:hypothetical protein